MLGLVIRSFSYVIQIVIHGIVSSIKCGFKDVMSCLLGVWCDSWHFLSVNDELKNSCQMNILGIGALQVLSQI